MNEATFKKLVLENFPTDMPDPSRLFEGIRVESGHEKLECLTSVEWPEFSAEVIDSVAGEFWQLSNTWTKYYLPAVMSLTSQLELNFNVYGELSDQQDSLMECMFSYWYSFQNFQANRYEISKNIFYGLKLEQIDILEHWVNAIDFKGLNDTHQLPESFDYSDKNLREFIRKVRKFRT